MLRNFKRKAFFPNDLSKLFSLLIYLDAAKFVMLKTVNAWLLCSYKVYLPKSVGEPLPNNIAKCPLPLDVRRSETS